jgi:hypothetical protein
LHFLSLSAELEFVMIHQQPTTAELKSAFEASRLPPKETFDRMVRRGIVNAKGELTRLFGGTAEPEQEALDQLHDDSPTNGFPG